MVRPSLLRSLAKQLEKKERKKEKRRRTYKLSFSKTVLQTLGYYTLKPEENLTRGDSSDSFSIFLYRTRKFTHFSLKPLHQVLLRVNESSSAYPSILIGGVKNDLSKRNFTFDGMITWTMRVLKNFVKKMFIISWLNIFLIIAKKPSLGTERLQSNPKRKKNGTSSISKTNILKNYCQKRHVSNFLQL